MATPGSERERCLTTIIRFVRVDLFSHEQCFHYSLISILSSEREQSLARIIWFVGVNIFLHG